MVSSPEPTQAPAEARSSGTSSIGSRPSTRTPTRRACPACRSRRRCAWTQTARSRPAWALPFTHILKPAGTGGFEALPLIEWLGLSLARAIGLPVPEAALVRMPDGMPPALLVERFDIRDARRRPATGSPWRTCARCSTSSRTTKYTGTIERVARAIRALSSAPDDDLLILLRRVLFAWLIADGDMHLKNMALLKTAQAGRGRFSSSAPRAGLRRADDARLSRARARPHGAEARRQGRAAPPRRLPGTGRTGGPACSRRQRRDRRGAAAASRRTRRHSSSSSPGTRCGRPRPPSRGRWTSVGPGSPRSTRHGGLAHCPQSSPRPGAASFRPSESRAVGRPATARARRGGRAQRGVACEHGCVQCVLRLAGAGLALGVIEKTHGRAENVGEAKTSGRSGSCTRSS